MLRACLIHLILHASSRRLVRVMFSCAPLRAYDLVSLSIDIYIILVFCVSDEILKYSGVSSDIEATDCRYSRVPSCARIKWAQLTPCDVVSEFVVCMSKRTNDKDQESSTSLELRA